MRNIYIIAISKILSAKKNISGVGFPFVSDIHVYDHAMFATDDFYILCDIYNCEITHMSDDGTFAHAVGIYEGEKVSITLQTAYKTEEPGFDGIYST